MIMRAGSLLLVLVLAGCASAEPPMLDNPEPEPPYRALILDKLPAMFPPGDAANPAPPFDPKTAPMSISGLRRVRHWSGWAWLACLRTQQGARSLTYAVFIQKGAVIDWRSSVEFDDCGRQTYVPLERPAPGKPGKKPRR
jgi:hypothetical protein